MKKPVFTAADADCYIDGSASRTDLFDREVIQLAIDNNWQLDENDAQWFDNTADEDNQDDEYLESIAYMSDEAISYLNTLCGEDCYWTLDEQALFLVARGSEMDEYLS